MVIALYVILGGWGATYAGVLAWEFWRRRSLRAAIGSLILSVGIIAAAGIVIWQRAT